MLIEELEKVNILIAVEDDFINCLLKFKVGQLELNLFSLETVFNILFKTYLTNNKICTIVLQIC